MVGDLLGNGVVVGLSDLVHQSHDVVIGPSTLEQIVGLLQHFAQTLRSDVAVSLTPSLDGRGQKGVAHSKSGRSENVGDGGIDGRVIAVVITLFDENQVVLLHNFFAENHGQEFVVGDLLDQSSANVFGLLEEGLVAPVRVDLAK